MAYFVYNYQGDDTGRHGDRGGALCPWGRIEFFYIKIRTRQRGFGESVVFLKTEKSRFYSCMHLEEAAGSSFCRYDG